MSGFAIGGYGFGGGWGDYGAGYGFGFGGGVPVSANTAAYGWSGFQGIAGFLNAGGSATQFAGWGSGAGHIGGGLWNYSFDWSGILAGLSDTINTIADGFYAFLGRPHNWGQAPIWEYAAPWAVGNTIDIEAEGDAKDEAEPKQRPGDAEPPAVAAKPADATATKKTPVEIAREVLPADKRSQAEALIAAMEKRKLPQSERLIKRVAKRMTGTTAVDTAAAAVQKAWRAELIAAKARRAAAAKPAEPAAAPAGVARTAASVVKESEVKPSEAKLKPFYYGSEAECVGAGAHDCIPIENGEYEGLK